MLDISVHFITHVESIANLPAIKSMFMLLIIFSLVDVLNFIKSFNIGVIVFHSMALSELIPERNCLNYVFVIMTIKLCFN